MGHGKRYQVKIGQRERERERKRCIIKHFIHLAKKDEWFDITTCQSLLKFFDLDYTISILKEKEKALYIKTIQFMFPHFYYDNIGCLSFLTELLNLCI